MAGEDACYVELRYPRESGEGCRPLGSGNEILLQAFNWESARQKGCSWYEHLQKHVGTIKQIGISAVWLPPPSDSVSAEGYLPRTLENLDSKYGTAAELRSLIAAFHRVDVRSVVDCVLNHRCADKQDAEGRWNVFSGDYAWDAGAVCQDNLEYGGTGGKKEGEDFTAAPNLDHENPKVKQDLKKWLRRLKSETKADGWRFDFVKGYPGRHVKDYIRASDPTLAVGEFWDTCSYDEEGELLPDQNKHRQRTIDWIDSTGGAAAAFDFTTKAILQEALQKKEYWRLRDADGKPPGVIGWWPAHAVTFLDNHDTGSTQQHWPFPPDSLHEGYAYILSHPGMPCVFIDHILGEQKPDAGERSLQSTIQTLIAARKKLQISATCSVKIAEASDQLYAAIIDDKLAVKLGAAEWDPEKVVSQTWNPILSGANFAVWTLGGVS